MLSNFKGVKSWTTEVFFNRWILKSSSITFAKQKLNCNLEQWGETKYYQV